MKRNITNYIVAFFAMLALWSCSDVLDIEPGEVVFDENRYKSEEDARTALLGVYSEAHKIVEQYVILNELRADLIDVTETSDEYLKQINEHRVDSLLANPYTDIKQIYKVINNCNDALVNIKALKNKNIITRAEYNYYYSPILTLRNWLYLNMSMHFDKVLYINKPVNSRKPDEVFPMLSLDQMVDTLLTSMASHTEYYYFSGTSVGGIDLNYQFINPYFFIGDLLMLNGDYAEAAGFYKYIMNEWSSQYKLTAATGVSAPSDANISNNWAKFFTEGSSTTEEVISMFQFSNDYNSNNKLQELFANGSSGLYRLKPSALSINNWDTEGDLYRGLNNSYVIASGQPIVNKYKSTENDSKLIIYRAGTCYLRYCEAVNRMGYPKVALDILNQGPKAKYQNQANLVLQFDTFYYYKFSGTPINCLGVRGRVLLPKDTAIVGATSLKDSVLAVESKIFKEYGLETAYEGMRWQDYMRFAHRMIKDDNNTDGAVKFVADGITQKFTASNSPVAEGIRTRLGDMKNWYLHFPKVKDLKVQE